MPHRPSVFTLTRPRSHSPHRFARAVQAALERGAAACVTHEYGPSGGAGLHRLCELAEAPPSPCTFLSVGLELSVGFEAAFAGRYPQCKGVGLDPGIELPSKPHRNLVYIHGGARCACGKS